jgi:hypothetical protein
MRIVLSKIFAGHRIHQLSQKSSWKEHYMSLARFNAELKTAGVQ